MTPEERAEYEGRFDELWNEFLKNYPTFSLVPKEVGRYFFEKGREDVMDRVWKEIKK